MKLTLNPSLCDAANTYEMGWNLCRSFLLQYADDRNELDSQIEKLYNRFESYLDNDGYAPNGTLFDEFAKGALELFDEIDELDMQIPSEK